MTWFDLIKDERPSWRFHNQAMRANLHDPQDMYIIEGDHCCKKAFKQASNLGYVTKDSITDCVSLKNSLMYENYRNLEDGESKEILGKIIDDWMNCEGKATGKRLPYDWKKYLNTIRL
jgi:hypothetical protein